MVGFDREIFYNEVNDIFLCKICFKVSKDPRIAKECKHLFCSECILNVLKVFSKFRCPSDNCLNKLNKDGFENIDSNLLSIYNALSIRCEFCEGTCEEKIYIKDYESHIKKCAGNPNKRTRCEDCEPKLTTKSQENYDCTNCLSQKIKKRKQIDENSEKNKSSEINFHTMTATTSSCNTSSIIKTDIGKLPKHWESIIPQKVQSQLEQMITIFTNFAPSTENSDVWNECDLFELVTKWLENNQNAKKILLKTDLRVSLHLEALNSLFSKKIQKENNPFMKNIFMFKLIEPIVNSRSKILIIGYVECVSLSHLFAQKVKHVTFVMNPKYVESSRYKTNLYFSKIKQKIEYLEISNSIDSFIEKIKSKTDAFDIIISFEYYSNGDIRCLVEKLCPSGMMICYEKSIITKHCLFRDDSGTKLNHQVLVSKDFFRQFNLIPPFNNEH